MSIFKIITTFSLKKLCQIYIYDYLLIYYFSNPLYLSHF